MSNLVRQCAREDVLAGYPMLCHERHHPVHEDVGRCPARAVARAWGNAHRLGDEAGRRGGIVVSTMVSERPGIAVLLVQSNVTPARS